MLGSLTASGAIGAEFYSPAHRALAALVDADARWLAEHPEAGERSRDAVPGEFYPLRHSGPVLVQPLGDGEHVRIAIEAVR